MQLTDVQYQKLRTIVLARVKIRRTLIAPYPSVNADDLFQVGMIRAIAAHKKYQPSWSYSSWIGRAADSGIISAIRHLRGTGKPRPSFGGLDNNILNIHDSVQSNQIQNTPESFLLLAIELGKRCVKNTPTRGRIYPHAKLVALAALRQDRQWSYRTMAFLMQGDKMRSVLDMPKVPHLRTIHYCETKHHVEVSRILKKTRRFFASQK